MKSIKTISLGCKVNTYENAAIKNLFLNNGYVLSDSNPAVVIINTCSVTATADQKSRQHIRKIMKEYPDAIIVVMGCYSQTFHNYIFNDLKVHIVLGTSDRDKILQYVNQYQLDKKRIDCVKTNPRLYKCYEELGTTPYFENVRAYLKIQDGCDNFCSYCLIPYIRGKARSRKKEDIIHEAENIINQGFHEIILAGIHVGGYGNDFNDGYNFSSLIDDLSSLKGLDRLTISSIEASEIDDKLIELIKTRKNIARHLHIPLQSGSASVLKNMNRKYSKEEFLSKIKKIQNEIPHIMIASDIITGFPMESDNDFLEGFEFIKKCNFNMLHVFPYSMRDGTIAAKMEGQIKPEIKKERTKKLIKLSDELFEQYLKNNDGKTLKILVESFDPSTNICKGLSDNYIECTFKGTKEMVNTIVDYKYSYIKK